MQLGPAICAILSLVVIIAIIAAAHYLNQIRDILRDIHETQKRLASRLGVSKP